MAVSCIIACGGNSSRMRGTDKLLYELGSEPVIVRTVKAFDKISEIGEIIVCTKEEKIEEYKDILKRYDIKKPLKFAQSGATRQESVANGLKETDPAFDYICFHDGARPFVSEKTIINCIEAAYRYKAAVVCVPVKDTVKIADDEFIKSTPDRSCLFSAQTPQIFERGEYLNALKKAQKSGLSVTDDSSILEAAGVKPFIVIGEYENIKLTTPEDLITAQMMLNLSKNEEKAMRIGHGYDVHRLVEGRKLILGGVKIPFEKGLLGHSDADVLVHAVMDSMLGALALGDIGKLFPDTMPEYKGACSIELLKKVTEVSKEKGYRISNLDCTVCAQVPKLAPFIEEMRKNIADAADIDFEKVSVKATTEEGLGFTGEGLGISATAVVLMEKA